MRTEVKLSKRLERIASFVQPGSRVADIGTDHGYVPIWLVQKGVCPSALAMDVRKGPLERAEEHVEEVGLSGKIELRLSDGLAKLKAGEADTVVIAGMGGKLTCRILEQGRHVWENWSEGKERLILSPQSEQDEVRYFLEEQGFSILREAMLTDEGKYYIVIEAARGTMRPGREQDYRFGADLIRKKDPVLLAYLEKEEKMTRQVLAGLTENDAQNKKETLEASEAGETAISRRAARINELTAYLALNAFCILFAITILALEFSNCSIKSLEHENETLAQLLECDKQQYEQAKKDMEKINIRYHDLKQQYSRATDEERARLEEEMNNLNLRYLTGNKALDITLTQKSALCGQAGIQLVCSADGRCLENMKHYHIYSLLGNALDNAIECLTQVSDASKRVITLDISRCRDMAVIRVQNYTPAPPTLRDGAIVTTKQDTEEHGYGIKSIKSIAELYGGTADCFVEDSIFYLVVTFPCGKSQKETA